MQKRFKLISVLLLFTLFFTLLPTPILAQGIINTINEQNIINTPPMENIKKART